MELFHRRSQLNYSAAGSFQYDREALESIIPKNRGKGHMTHYLYSQLGVFGYVLHRKGVNINLLHP